MEKPWSRRCHGVWIPLGSILKAPIRIFFWQSPGCILGQIPFRTSLGGPSIFSQWTPLSALRNIPRAPFTTIPPRLFHRFSHFYTLEVFLSVSQSVNRLHLCESVQEAEAALCVVISCTATTHARMDFRLLTDIGGQAPPSVPIYIPYI